MVNLRPDEACTELLKPVRALLERALVLLPDAPPLEVRTGGVRGFWRLEDDVVVLSSDLSGPGTSHPDDVTRGGAVPPLDRWRRAAGSVLEAASLRELVRRTGVEPVEDWRWLGAAIHAADAVAPELSLALPDLETALRTGSPGSFPRAGVAVMRAWQAEGSDPIRQVRYLLEGGVVSAAEWARLGAWVLGPSGLLSTLPVPVDRVGDADIPCDLPAWSWQPLRVPPHPRGGFVAVEGDGQVAEPWAVADGELRTLASAASTPVRLVPEPGAPVGEWEVASAEGFGQVMGARGVRFVLASDGGLQIVLADAFVGPLAAIAMAEQVGTSGVCQGRWSVAGPRRLRFHGLTTSSLTLHGRQRDRFLVPARGFGLGEWIEALGEETWAWQGGPADRLVLRGRMMGGDVDVRLKRPSLD
ncbi:MAG: hypothetical protein H6735_12680 [Alphaproteobacteria bacterium]|nr:hypothetical protein [Alphaproteobacteria bacterium]